MRNLLLSVLFLIFVQSSFTLQFELEAGGISCFYELFAKAKAHTVFFEVVRGGQRDIRVQVTSPSQQVVFEELHTESEGQLGLHELEPEEGGYYELCFDNRMSTWSSKVIQFSIYREDPDSIDEEVPVHKKKPILSDDVNDVMEAFDNLNMGLSSLMRHFKIWRTREAQHREVVANTDQRMMLISVGELLILLGVSLGQIFVIRRAFDIRKRP